MLFRLKVYLKIPPDLLYTFIKCEKLIIFHTETLSKT